MTVIVAKRDKIKAVLVLKGGSGSGHHGHSGRPGKRGGSLPGSSEFLDSTLSEDSRRKILDILDNELISEKHLSGLQKITTGLSESIPSWVKEDGTTIPGYYHKKSIHLHPRIGVNRVVLLHELGHHVASKLFGNGRVGLSKLYHKLSSRKMNDEKLADLGLRRYSLTHLNEFLADSFVLYAGGRDSPNWNDAKRNFNTALQKIDSSLELDSIFGG
jgi:hypothetical protein